MNWRLWRTLPSPSERGQGEGFRILDLRPHPALRATLSQRERDSLSIRSHHVKPASTQSFEDESS
jgi:hypothetical protein